MGAQTLWFIGSGSMGAQTLWFIWIRIQVAEKALDSLEPDQGSSKALVP